MADVAGRRIDFKIGESLNAAIYLGSFSAVDR